MGGLRICGWVLSKNSKERKMVLEFFYKIEYSQIAFTDTTN